MQPWMLLLLLLLLLSWSAVTRDSRHQMRNSPPQQLDFAAKCIRKIRSRKTAAV